MGDNIEIQPPREQLPGWVVRFMVALPVVAPTVHLIYHLLARALGWPCP